MKSINCTSGEGSVERGQWIGVSAVLKNWEFILQPVRAFFTVDSRAIIIQ